MDNDFVFLFVVLMVVIHNSYHENLWLKTIHFIIKNVSNQIDILGVVLPSDVALTDDGSNNCVESFSTNKA